MCASFLSLRCSICNKKATQNSPCEDKPETKTSQQFVRFKKKTTKLTNHYPMNHLGCVPGCVSAFTVHPASHTHTHTHTHRWCTTPKTHPQSKPFSIMMSYRWPIARTESCPRNFSDAGQYFTSPAAAGPVRQSLSAPLHSTARYPGSLERDTAYGEGACASLFSFCFCFGVCFWVLC